MLRKVAIATATTAWVAGAGYVAYQSAGAGYIETPESNESSPTDSNNEDNQTKQTNQQSNQSNHSHPHSHSHSHSTHDWREQAKETAAWRQTEAKAVSADFRQQVFDDGASSYDDEIGTDEFVMGLLLMRRFLLRNAKGQVLETAAGGARNLGSYPSKCAVTLIDSSPKMLEAAKEKINKLKDKSKKRFATYTTSNDSSLAFDTGSFDTVVDTFGLCSFEDPVEGLKEMSRVLKPGGTMLLLEHGRAHYDFLNNVLDNSAYKHAKRWGCWYNRDMNEIFQEAGMNITTQYRFHFGTTWYVIAKKDHDRIE